MKNKILKVIFIVFLFSIPQIKGTNSYFTSTEKKLSVTMTTAAYFSDDLFSLTIPINQPVSIFNTDLIGTPTPSPTIELTPTLSETPTPTPTEEAQPSPTVEPTSEPTTVPTVAPTIESQPTTQPEATPTEILE